MSMYRADVYIRKWIFLSFFLSFVLSLLSVFVYLEKIPGHVMDGIKPQTIDSAKRAKDKKRARGSKEKGKKKTFSSSSWREKEKDPSSPYCYSSKTDRD